MINITNCGGSMLSPFCVFWRIKMKSRLIKKARELNIYHIGFCKADFDSELYDILKKRRELFGKSAFEEEDIIKRADPKLLMEDCKSVIVCLFPYYCKDLPEGNLAMYAKVTDYHTVCKRKLNELMSTLHGYKCACYADIDPLCDRFLAFRAGLGFFGKNSMLINEELGSYFAIGFILTDAEIEADKPQNNTCKGCNLCIKHCPGGALSQNFGFDAAKCLSYITQAKQLSNEQLSLLQKSENVVGCDICQKVCPHNKNIPETCMTEFLENKISEINFEDISRLSNREFKEKYAVFAFSWLGKKRIVRNFTEKTNN